ncbi:MAG TPA: type III-B CRISPR module RAMP protein Cmr1 [Ignavibacteria bacterium]|nr:type III-B CRISPR module RAMP protein Cmr1 [Ignavibacteria bacterium]
MKTIEFECEIITPMFLTGADGKTPELRAPSIKGAMRFWWRAMNGYLSIADLRKEEGKIFGASDEKIGRSVVIIRINSRSGYGREYKYTPVPHKSFQLFAFPSAHKFTLTLSLTSNVKYNDAIIFDIEKLKNLFILVSILGDFGKRSRRGFGSVRILSIDKKNYNFEYNLQNVLDLVDTVSNDKYAIKDIKVMLKKPLTAQYPFLKEIQLGKEYDSWEELVKKVGEASHRHNIDSLGFAKSKKRLASPIYVSVLKNLNDKYLPIISSLNTVFEDGGKIDDGGQERFKEEILK